MSYVIDFLSFFFIVLLVSFALPMTLSPLHLSHGSNERPGQQVWLVFPACYHILEDATPSRWNLR
jgi:hypothetical protein